MNVFQQALTFILGLFGLVVIVGGLYAALTNARKEAQTKMLRESNSDYVARLAYIEPRYKELQEQNKVLRTLLNPTAHLERLEGNQAQMLEVLDKQSDTLHEIQRRLHPDRGTT